MSTNNKKFLFIILIILTVLNLLLLAALIFQKNIVVNNQSKNYSISYEETPLFSQYLKEWKVFEKELKPHIGSMNKAQKITIELTDSPQSHQMSFTYDQNMKDLHLQSTLEKLFFLPPPRFPINSLLPTIHNFLHSSNLSIKFFYLSRPIDLTNAIGSAIIPKLILSYFTSRSRDARDSRG